VNRCETPLPADASLAARALSESCTRPSHSARTEAVGAMDGVAEGLGVGFGTGALVGLPGSGVGAAVGAVDDGVVGLADGVGVGA
jgi:hypothetical protein